MSILNVVLYPDDPLTQVAEHVTEFGPELERFVEDMFETMHAYEGVGLAAPQVGVSKRLFVLHEPEGQKMCLVNPEILEAEGTEESSEGCLSLPQIYVPVQRATRIQVRAKDPGGRTREFEATDLLARIIQHETDHLDGIVVLDRTNILSRQAALQEWEGVRERLLSGAGRS
jgi:peptide deformylase